MQHNEMTVRFSALSQNESFARVVASAFAAQLNPTLNEMADIKTAVSEAVTNAIVHGYGGGTGEVELFMALDGQVVTVTVRDRGRGIEDVEAARQPFFTTAPDDERSGMGFSVMEAFMDELEVSSEVGNGTSVTMKKRIEVGN